MEKSKSPVDADEDSNLIPKSVKEYRKKEYWDWRYEQSASSATEITYEWFKGYEYFRSAIRPYLCESDQILMFGCGNSKFSEEMCQDGFKEVVNVDYSEKVIEIMKERTRETYPSLKWYTMDFRDMSELKESSFEIVLDKGSLDALWSDGGSQWDPSEPVLVDIRASLKEVIRLLKPGGKFITITFGQPHFRLPHLNRPGEWELIATEKVGLYFIYVFEKNK